MYHLSDEQRRICIAVYFADALDAPGKGDWDGADGTTSVIQRELNVPAGSRDLIKRVLANVEGCHLKCVEYPAGRKDPSSLATISA